MPLVNDHFDILINARDVAPSPIAIPSADIPATLSDSCSMAANPIEASTIASTIRETRGIVTRGSITTCRASVRRPI